PSSTGGVAHRLNPPSTPRFGIPSTSTSRESPRRSGPSGTRPTRPHGERQPPGAPPAALPWGFKTESIRTIVFHGGPFRTLADVEFATASWVDWYNNRRLHGSLGMLIPVEFETLHYEAPTRDPALTK